MQLIVSLSHVSSEHLGSQSSAIRVFQAENRLQYFHTHHVFPFCAELKAHMDYQRQSTSGIKLRFMPHKPRGTVR